MAKQITVSIVGAGSLGSALAQALHEAGIVVTELVYRRGPSAKHAQKLAKLVGAPAVLFDHAEFTGDVIWICVADSAIGSTAAAIAERRSWKGKTVFHSSGALSSDELMPLRREGAKVAAVHPMMTFVRSSVPSMIGVPFALEGDRSAVGAAKKLVKALGGRSFEIRKEDKPLYHAFGAFVSPLIIAQLAAAERIGRELGLNQDQTKRIVAPILQQTVKNYVEHGPAAAFSGPIARGDVLTIRKHLTALKRVRGAAEIYRALAKVAVEELPSKDAQGIAKTLKRK